MWDESPLFGQGPPHITLASSDKLTDSAAPPSVQAVTGTWELIDNLSRGSQRMMKLRHLYFDIKLNYQSSHYQPEKRSIHRPFIYVLTFYHRGLVYGRASNEYHKAISSLPDRFVIQSYLEDVNVNIRVCKKRL
ncbi:hypothetical protein H9L39_01499 [Fusarium oxysporum f. sp. albedinis]|nr:hypothetical protein H9L39_01499 [Fusarium oxysporum f. sp. albedinis]